MRCVVQRVKQALVKVHENVVGEIKEGLLVLAAWEDADTQEDIEWMVHKICNQRIFSDAEGKMNHSIRDTNGGVLLVSQFTLFASTKKGNRPSFIQAAKPKHAEDLFGKTTKVFEEYLGKNVATGIFGANMQVQLINDGPVTLIMDSKNKN